MTDNCKMFLTELTAASPVPDPVAPKPDSGDPVTQVEDIYRGDLPLPPPPKSPSLVSVASSSSSSSFLGTGRLGAIAAVVEVAITRWARGRSYSDSSSSSSSSSSSKSSVITTARPHVARRRMRTASNAGNLRSTMSQQDIVARMKAMQESRHIPHEFTLYLPPSLSPIQPPTSKSKSSARLLHERVFKTSSLPVIHSQLDAALKKSIKARRQQDRSRNVKPATNTANAPDSDAQHTRHHDYMLPENIKAPSRAASFTELPTLKTNGKGKEREVPLGQAESSTSRVHDSVKQYKIPKAWWLNIASPTWEDMRTIGKLLHLHPLTLEDILHQDPREKVELFPKLGYYFVVFRAIESGNTRNRYGQYNAQIHGSGLNNLDGGSIGNANIYLVVFREGICSFHFADISEHTERVRNRIVLLEETINMSSDWIAHGILDSVVDSFIPFVEQIERDVATVETIIFSDGLDTAIEQGPVDFKADDIELTPISLPAHRSEKEMVDKAYSEKSNPEPLVTAMRFALPKPNAATVVRRTKRFAYTVLHFLTSFHRQSYTPGSARVSTLWRMAVTRRLVTSLSRLLASKSDIIAQIRKRLIMASEQSFVANADGGDGAEIAIYMGDIHDHILTLQHSLAHYERMLSQTHPTQLSQLHSKQGTDKALMSLSIVSIAVLCVQPLIALFSLNVQVPTNRNATHTNEPYYYFAVVIALSIVILLVYGATVRWWWLRAKRRTRTLL